MIDLNEKEVELVSGGTVVPGYPANDPGLSDPLENQNPWKPGVHYAY